MRDAGLARRTEADLIVTLATGATKPVVTTAHPLDTADELAAQRKDSGAAFLLAVSPFRGKAEEGAGARSLRARRGRGCDAVRRAAREL
jgi:hypothetical protein